MVIVVAYDWRSGSWRWFLDADDSQGDFHLLLPPGLAAFRIVPGSGECRGDPPDFPAHYQVTYTQNTERREWQGQVVELHLDHTRRNYGKPLSASDILESWRVHVQTGDTGGRDAAGDGDEDEDGEDVQAEVPAAFDAVNLYDLYRAMRALRTRFAELESEPQAQRALLVGRSDSVMALARLADGEGEAPVVRYLVLRELSSIVADCKGYSLDGGPLRRVHDMKRRAKTTTLKQLASELRGDRESARKMLDWFEKRLAKMDRAGK